MELLAISIISAAVWVGRPVHRTPVRILWVMCVHLPTPGEAFVYTRVVLKELYDRDSRAQDLKNMSPCGGAPILTTRKSLCVTAFNKQ